MFRPLNGRRGLPCRGGFPAVFFIVPCLIEGFPPLSRGASPLFRSVGCAPSIRAAVAIPLTASACAAAP